MSTDYTALLAYGIPVTLEELTTPRALAFLGLPAPYDGDEDDVPAGVMYWTDWLYKPVRDALAPHGVRVVDASDCLGGSDRSLMLSITDTIRWGDDTFGIGSEITIAELGEDQIRMLRSVAGSLGVSGKPSWRLGLRVH